MFDWRTLLENRFVRVAAFVLLVVVIGWLIYVIFFRGAPAPPLVTPTPTTTPPGELPIFPPGVTIPRVEPGAPGELPSAVARGGITETQEITRSPARGITRAGSDVAYYDDLSGKFFTVSPTGNIVALSDKTFPRLQSVTWSPSARDAILEFPDGANIYYNFGSNEQVTLPKHWQDFSFSPDGASIVFKNIALDPENNFLAVSDPRGNGARVIASLGENSGRVIPDWSPNRQIVASFTEPLDGERSELFFLGLNDENFRKVVVNGYGFDAQWNPNGTQLLYSVSSSATGERPSLWIVNAQGEAIGSGRRPLNLNTTVDKCVFEDTTTLYCAVPQFLPEGVGLLPSLASGIPDDLYKINVATGASSLLAEFDSVYTVTALELSPDGRLLYFTDESTGRLRSIRLR